MSQPLQTILLNQMRARNPQSYNAIMEAQQKGTTPQEMVKQMMQNVSPEQTQQILNQAKYLGVPDEVIQQIQNIK